MTDLQIQLARACDSVTPLIGTGVTAQYIPALAEVDINKFGAAIVTFDSKTATFGQSQEAFSIQSIAKVFMLAMTLKLTGNDVWQRVHYEPSGNSFNSIVQLEIEKGIPRNPFINAGALVMSDLLLDHFSPQEGLNAILELIRTLAQDSSIAVNQTVASSELAHAYRNTSLLHFMKSFGNIKNPIADILELYCQLCSLSMTCEQLARSCLFLAHQGTDPLSETTIISSQQCRQINAIMMTCGHYDASGHFALRVGLPGKSGVGGGIVTIVPQKAVISVWSPGLNTNGNSTAGTAALEAIVNETGWSIL